MASSPVHPRLGCSTITFRHLPLATALERIVELGFAEIDLGALPGVCDHVPMPLGAQQVRHCADTVRHSGLAVRAINADVGALNAPERSQDELSAKLEPIVELADTLRASTVLLPAGALDREPLSERHTDVRRLADALQLAQRRCADAGIELLVEAPHYYRLCHDLTTTAELLNALDGTDVATVLDVSHVVAAGGDPGEAVELMGARLRHVHLRDAVPGDINRSLGRGRVDFVKLIRRLNESGYDGHFSLELETHDITDDQRPAETAKAAHWISTLLNTQEYA